MESFFKNIFGNFRWFGIFFIVFTVLFLAVFIFVFVITIKRFRGSSKDRKAPELTVEAKVVSKRSDISRHNALTYGKTPQGYIADTANIYYVTFEVESGDRLEFPVDGRDYGLLTEGDRGRLTFKGSTYLGFERTK